MQTAYRYWISLLWLAIVAQIAAAAYGAFYAADKLNSQSGPDERRTISETAFNHGFGFHTAFGYLVFLGTIVLLVLALAGRLGRQRVTWALGFAIAVAVQVVLAWISEGVHGVGILHGINALLIFGVATFMMANAWGRMQRASTEAAASPAS